MIYLDTHVVVWFFANDKQRFPNALQALMNQHDWYISPMVRLELQYLHEVGRINVPGSRIIADLSHRAGLAICPKPFDEVTTAATQITWTRDPFDRIIVAQAASTSDILITRDETIHAQYAHATW